MKTKVGCIVALCALGCGLPLPDEMDETAGVEQGICANPDGCFNENPLPEPAPPLFTERTATSLTVKYTVNSEWTGCQLQRRAPGGTWGGATSTSCQGAQTRFFDDLTRLPDSITCYRVKASNARGPGYSGERCGLTLPSGGSNPAVNRLQLRLKVANVSDAETSNRVSVRLSSLGFPGINQTGLNGAARPNPVVPPSPLQLWEGDFSRGRDFTYDLELRNISNLRDITQIRILNHGSDGLCVESFELKVNGAVALAKTFGSSTCRWLDTDGNPELYVSFDELRSTPSFTGFMNPPLTNPVTRGEVEARLEGIVGNIIWARTDLDWGKIYNGRAVEVARLSATRLSVDLDLEGIINNAPNAEVDIDFEAQLSFVRNASNNGFDLLFDVQNFHASADFPWWAEVLGSVCSLSYVGGGSGTNCATYFEGYIKQAVERAFSLSGKRIPLAKDSDLAMLGCTTPDVMVQQNGDLQFACH